MTTRYPLQALADAEGITLGEHHSPGDTPDPGAPLHGTALLAARLQTVLGGNPASYQRAIRRAAADGLTEAKADVWASSLGHHPGTIWGDLWYHAPAAQAAVA